MAAISIAAFSSSPKKPLFIVIHHNDTLSVHPEQTWETVYDVLNRPVSEINPLGRPLQQRYPDNTVHDYLEYDAHGNLRLESLPDGTLVEHDYDALDRRTARRLLGTNLSAQTSSAASPTPMAA